MRMCGGGGSYERSARGLNPLGSGSLLCTLGWLYGMIGRGAFEGIYVSGIRCDKLVWYWKLHCDFEVVKGEGEELMGTRAGERV